jgi:hypothetical protein
VIPAEYKIADEIKKSPKGYTIVIERVGGKKKAEQKVTKDEKEHEDQ